MMLNGVLGFAVPLQKPEKANVERLQEITDNDALAVPVHIPEVKLTIKVNCEEFDNA